MIEGYIERLAGWEGREKIKKIFLNLCVPAIPPKKRKFSKISRKRS
jgi:hypothetical protein